MIIDIEIEFLSVEISLVVIRNLLNFTKGILILLCSTLVLTIKKKKKKLKSKAYLYILFSFLYYHISSLPSLLSAPLCSALISLLSLCSALLSYVRRRERDR